MAAASGASISRKSSQRSSATLKHPAARCRRRPCGRCGKWGERSGRGSNPEVAPNPINRGSRAGGRAQRRGPPARTPFPWVAGGSIPRNPSEQVRPQDKPAGRKKQHYAGPGFRIHEQHRGRFETVMPHVSKDHDQPRTTVGKARGREPISAPSAAWPGFSRGLPEMSPRHILAFTNAERTAGGRRQFCGPDMILEGRRAW